MEGKSRGDAWLRERRWQRDNLKDRSFANLTKEKSLREVLDICESDQAKKDACFPNPASVRGLIYSKMPSAIKALDRRFDLVSIEDYIMFVRALLEGRCSKYGILTNLKGLLLGGKVVPFYELVGDDNNIQPVELLIDGHSPKPGTGCYLVAIVSTIEAGNSTYDWRAFPVVEKNLKDVSTDTTHDIMYYTAEILAMQMKEMRATSLIITYGEEFGDDDRDQEHVLDPDDSIEDIVEMILPSFELEEDRTDLSHMEMIDDANNSTSFWLETAFKNF